MVRRAPLSLLVTLALIGFASNSLLCRTALLRARTIDPASFTTIRIVAGALTLSILALLRSGANRRPTGTWRSAAALFVYAITFSLAYVRLTTATGALILFTVVQLTMIGSVLLRGDRLRATQTTGLIIAFAGLVLLCAPGVEAPSAIGALLMSCAGVAWGIYSLRGRSSDDPLRDTAGNFARAVPLALLTTLFFLSAANITARGALLAAASGAFASGLGYSLWYAAVPRLTAVRASIVQLAVPVFTAAGGVLILGETITLRLIVAAAATLGGVALSFRRSFR